MVFLGLTSAGVREKEREIEHEAIFHQLGLCCLMYLRGETGPESGRHKSTETELLNMEESRPVGATGLWFRSFMYMWGKSSAAEISNTSI